MNEMRSESAMLAKGGLAEVGGQKQKQLRAREHSDLCCLLRLRSIEILAVCACTSEYIVCTYSVGSLMLSISKLFTRK